MFKKIACIILLSISTNVVADSLDEKVCTSILSSGIRSTYSVFSDQEKYDQYQSRLCLFLLKTVVLSNLILCQVH